MHHPEQIKPPWFLDSAVIQQWLDTAEVVFRESLVIRYTKTSEYGALLDLVQGAEGIVQPEPGRLHRAIEERRSVVALDISNQHLVAHQRYELWPDLKLAELRTAFVHPDYRGRGINTFMKRLLINEVIQKHADWRLLGYCYPQSKSKNIFRRVGFVPVDLSLVKRTWPGLVRDCNTNQCYLKNEFPCNCWVCCLTPE